MKKSEAHHQSVYDANKKALQRAMDAEVQLLMLRKEAIVNPGERKVQEIDRLW